MFLPRELKRLLIAIFLILTLAFVVTIAINNPYSRLRLLRLYYSVFSTEQKSKDEILRRYSRFPLVKRAEGVWVEGTVISIENKDSNIQVLGLSVNNQVIKVILGNEAGKIGYSEMTVLEGGRYLPYHSEEWSVITVGELSDLITPGSKVSMLIKYEIPSNADKCSSTVCEEYLSLLSENLEANIALAESVSREVLPRYEAYGPLSQILLYK